MDPKPYPEQLFGFTAPWMDMCPDPEPREIQRNIYDSRRHCMPFLHTVTSLDIML